MRLTFGGGNNDFPLWSPDGKYIIYTAEKGRTANLFRRPWEGSGSEERLTSSPNPQEPSSCSADGKFLAYGDNGRFAKFQDVINLALSTGNLPPDVTALQQRHFKPGGGINIKQQIAPNFGFFMRASLTDGRYQTVDYIDNDRQISAGFVFDGALWERRDDEIGIAGAMVSEYVTSATPLRPRSSGLFAGCTQTSNCLVTT